MKRFPVIVAIACAVALAASSAFAIDAGKWRVGANSSISYASESLDPPADLTANTQDFGVSGGYFVINDLEIGLGYRSFKYEWSDGISLTWYELSLISPYVQYYLPVGGNNLIFGLAYDTGSVTVVLGELDYTGFTVSVGYSIPIVDKLTLDLTGKYLMGSYDDGGTSIDSSGFRILAGLSLFL